MKTHWKKTIDKDWIGCYVLPEGKPIVVKLISIKYEEVKVKGLKDWYKVAYFEKNPYFDKPMLLSATTNLKRIEKLTGTPYIEDWVTLNLNVTLQQEWDKAFGGGKDWALRIADTAPTMTLPELKKENAKIWSNAVSKTKEVGIESALIAIKKRYSISDQTKKALEDEANKA